MSDSNKIFRVEPYRTSLVTRIATVDGPEVTVEETNFYALSGGQESDSGTIAGIPVRRAEWRGRDVVYTLGDGHGLEPGASVSMRIDWPRRYRLMRLHFAAEVVLELCYRQLSGIEKIGAHIGEHKARIDFRWPTPISPSFPQLEQETHALIDADRPIISAFSDRQAERRYWEVEGFSRVPCGGTHLRRTGEVGRIALRRKNIGGGKERIEIMLADPEIEAAV